MDRRVELPFGLASAAQARSFVTEVLEEWGCPELIDDSLLVVTELVVNATLHARSGTEVVITRTDGGVRIAVHDTSPTMPARHDFGPEAVTGRGLHILDALAPGWVAEPKPGGKVVVAEVKAPVTRAVPDR